MLLTESTTCVADLCRPQNAACKSYIPFLAACCSLRKLTFLFAMARKHKIAEGFDSVSNVVRYVIYNFLTYYPEFGGQTNRQWHDAELHISRHLLLAVVSPLNPALDSNYEDAMQCDELPVFQATSRKHATVCH